MDFPFTTDQCSMFPDGNYGGCCVEHDRAYHRGGSAMARLDADIALMKCVAAKAGIVLAVIMFIGVRFGGHPLLPTPWRWGYGWRYKTARYYASQEQLVSGMGDETLEPCLCGKPMGVLSRYIGPELHHQAICSDSACPLNETHSTKEGAESVWNRLARQYRQRPDRPSSGQENGRRGAF